jgi:uncharacterized phage-like protein YoqJ
MRAMITGHRPGRLTGHEWYVRNWIEDTLKEIRPEEFFTGMAQGVDQIAAECAKYNKIPYTCIYPSWRKTFHDKEINLMESARNVIFLYPQYNDGKDPYGFRDKWMVDHSDVLIAVWDGVEEGGTYETIEYAKEKGIKIFLYPYWGHEIEELVYQNRDSDSKNPEIDRIYYVGKEDPKEEK